MRVIQLLAIVFCGILVAAVIGAYAEFAASREVPSLKWFVFVAYTILLFGTVIQNDKASWRKRSFWLWLCAFAVVHVGSYVVLLQSVHNWRMIWFLPLTVAEYLVIESITFYNQHRIK